MLIQTPSGTCDLNSGEGGGGAGDARTTGTKIGGGTGAVQSDGDRGYNCKDLEGEPQAKPLQDELELGFGCP
uniref:Uncharacterized protein n=1 Tax=Leersia perrieri TaxID=77586 RepID=A0A0D9WKZ8_9ORYZ